MLGWQITVTALAPEEDDRGSPEAWRAATLASWSAGLGGLDWIEALVAQGKAAELSGNGYPSRYVARASDVLAILRQGLPAGRGPMVIGDDYAIPEGWTGRIAIHPDRIAACPGDRMLTIDAWDES
jgi:hypothetical protein